MRSWFYDIAHRLFNGGYFMVGKWSGIPVRLHWTAIIGALLFGRFEWAPAYWFAFLFLVAIHEMGHAVLVRRFRATPISLDIHGLGGLCHWRGFVSPLGVATIAWGGVAAQFVLYLLTMVAIAIFGAPSTPAMIDLRQALIEQNVFLIMLNLIPVPPLDGSKAWQLPGLLIARQMARRRENARRGTITKLRRLDNADAHIPSVQSDVDELLRRAADNSRDKSDPRPK
jgi:hypothetical protein